MKIGLLTGGTDKPYVLGLTQALLERGLQVDVVASDELVCDELLGEPQVNFLNYRGDTCASASRWAKLARVVKYYLHLLAFAARRQPQVFHILWANRFPLLDHIVLNVYYKLMGKRLLLTAHNINERKRNGNDSAWNRFTLRTMYRLMDQIFVHTEKMKTELREDFGLPAGKISVIPFGINNTLPNTEIDRDVARARLNIEPGEQVLLFFGRIAPYKGLDLAVRALAKLVGQGASPRLLIAGRVESGCEAYWQEIERELDERGLTPYVSRHIEFIPDADVELYFKAADALLMPYRAIFQSGVVFLSYSFGLPVLASDVGSFSEDIVEGRTGMIYPPDDAQALADTVRSFFCGPLFSDADRARTDITNYGNRKYSWNEVGKITCAAYDGEPRQAQPSCNN